MKKIAYVLVQDLVHPKKRLLSLLPKFFDPEIWHICVLTSWDDICEMSGAPDLFVNFKDSRDNWRMNTPNWYDTAFSTRIADFVVDGGCGYLAVHAGTLNVPRDHPLRTQVLHGSANAAPGEPVFKTNLLFGLLEGGHPFASYTDVTFIPLKEHPILAGVNQFTIRDEQLAINLQRDSDADILGKAISKEAGESIAVWAREAGMGRAAGIAMGHLTDNFLEPSFRALLANAVAWCGRVENGSGRTLELLGKDNVK